jgi:hypothetical protein
MGYSIYTRRLLTSTSLKDIEEKFLFDEEPAI